MLSAYHNLLDGATLEEEPLKKFFFLLLKENSNSRSTRRLRKRIRAHKVPHVDSGGFTLPAYRGALGVLLGIKIKGSMSKHHAL